AEQLIVELIGALAKDADRVRAPHHPIVVGDEETALAAGERLGVVEAERAHAPDRADAPAPVGGAVGLAGVLDDGETVPFGDDRDLVEVGRQAVDVYRYDGARARANEPLHVP